MSGEPILRAPVTRFATDAIGERELLAALLCRYVVGVTIETLFCRGRIADPQLCRNSARLRGSQDVEGLGVRVIVRPGHVLIEQDVIGLTRRHRAMTHRGSARRHSHVLIESLGWQNSHGGRRRGSE